MTEAIAIIRETMPYLQYLAPPLFVFCTLAVADMMIDVLIRMVRQAQKSYRL